MFLFRNLWVIAMTLIVNVASYAVSRAQEPEWTGARHLAHVDGGRQNERRYDTAVLCVGEALFQQSCAVCDQLIEDSVVGDRS